MLGPEIRPFKRPDWEPVPMEGFVNVEGKVIVGDDDLVLALLRFGEHGHINPHAGPNNTLVSCIEGERLHQRRRRDRRAPCGSDRVLAGGRPPRPVDGGLDDDDAHVRAFSTLISE